MNTEYILEEADPSNTFAEHVTKAANDSIAKATNITKKSNPWLNEACKEALNPE